MPEQSLADANESVIAEFRANGGHVGGYFAAVPRRCSPRPARNPGCYHNLVANCEVTVELGVEWFAATAHEVFGEERDELFERHAAAQPQLARYQAQTTRQIPVVALVRAP